MDTITVDAIAQHIHADIQEKKKKKHERMTLG